MKRSVLSTDCSKVPNWPGSLFKTLVRLSCLVLVSASTLLPGYCIPSPAPVTGTDLRSYRDKLNATDTYRPGKKSSSGKANPPAQAQSPAPARATAEGRTLPAVEKFISAAQEALKQDDTDRAFRILTEANKRYPAQARILLCMAQTCYADNRLDDARKMLEEIVAKQSPMVDHQTLSRALAALGNIACSLGNLEAAESYYQEAVRNDPGNGEHRFRLAQVNQLQTKFDEAFRQATEAVRQDRNHVGARLLLAAHFAARGKVNDAVRQLEECNRLDPDNPRILSQSGVMLRAAGRLSASIERHRKARSIDPADAGALEQIALIYGSKGDWINAREYAEEWTKIEPLNSAAWFVRAWACVNTRDLADAAGFLRKAMELDSTSVELKNIAAIISLDLRKAEEASNYLDAALKENPDYLPGRLNLATTQIVRGRWTAAIDLLRKTLSSTPAGPELFGMLAYAYAGAGQFSDSAAAAAEALALKKDEPAALLSLSIIDESRANLSAAVDKLRKASKYCPASPFILARLSLMLNRAGQTREAIDVAQQALQLAPANLSAKAAMAEALKSLGNFHGAVLLLKECVVRSPKDVQLRLSLAEAQERSGDAETALETLLKAEKLIPDSPSLLAELARLQLHQGKMSDAEVYARRSLEYDGHNAGSLAVLCDVLCKRGKLDAARRYCDRLLSIEPNSQQANLAAARVLYRTGEYRLALPRFEYAASIINQAADKEAFALCLERQGKLERAQALIRELLTEKQLSARERRLLMQVEHRLAQRIASSASRASRPEN